MRRSATTTAPVPTFRLLNRQRREAVPLAWLGRFARDAARVLRSEGYRSRAEWPNTCRVRHSVPAPMAGTAPVWEGSGRLAGPGEFVIAFVGAATMRRVHGVFLRQRTMTDVLTFRYDEAALLGEIVIAPSAARAYAAQHGLSYRRELARYVAHGLLHWLGHEDRTPAQQRHMHLLENDVLVKCGVRIAE